MKITFYNKKEVKAEDIKVGRFFRGYRDDNVYLKLESSCESKEDCFEAFDFSSNTVVLICQNQPVYTVGVESVNVKANGVEF